MPAYIYDRSSCARGPKHRAVELWYAEPIPGAASGLASCSLLSRRFAAKLALTLNTPELHINSGNMALHPEAEFMFTSESVNEGHPDKLADQVRAHCAHPSCSGTSAPGLPLADFPRAIPLGCAALLSGAASPQRFVANHRTAFHRQRRLGAPLWKRHSG